MSAAQLLDKIPEMTVSDTADQQVAMHVCQHRAVLSQCTPNRATSIECLIPLRQVMASCMMLHKYVVLCLATGSQMVATC